MFRQETDFPLENHILAETKLIMKSALHDVT